MAPLEDNYVYSEPAPNGSPQGWTPIPCDSGTLVVTLNAVHFHLCGKPLMNCVSHWTMQESLALLMVLAGRPAEHTAGKELALLPATRSLSSWKPRDMTGALSKRHFP